MDKIHILSSLFCFISVIFASTEKLLLISFDGFRHDYLDLARAKEFNISGFDKISQSGFRVMRVINEFITVTAPSHWTMVTGLHEESHGLVDNQFFDPLLNESFSLSNVTQSTQSKWFGMTPGIEPIWITNQRHGYQTAVLFWPGSLAQLHTHRPSKYYPVYNTTTPLRRKIDDALAWLSGEERHNLALIYHHEPDRQGHSTGPQSDDVFLTISNINNDIENLLGHIHRSTSLRKTLNVILTGDHGMTETSEDKVILLDNFVDPSLYHSPGSAVRVVWSLWPKQGITVQQIFAKFNNRPEYLKVYRKEDVPARWFYRNNQRIAPILVVADPGWVICQNKTVAETKVARGIHGYDPQFSDMSPFFLATGPGFADMTSTNRTVSSIRLIDLYPMMCHLLGLRRPAPHNGSLEAVRYLLRPSNEWIEFGSALDRVTVGIILILTILLALTFTVFTCLRYYHSRPPQTAFMRARLARKRLNKRQVPIIKPTSHSLRNSTEVDQVAVKKQQESQQHLLDTTPPGWEDDDDEYEMLPHISHRMDDAAFINMLREPKSSHP